MLKITARMPVTQRVGTDPADATGSRPVWWLIDGVAYVGDDERAVLAYCRRHPDDYHLEEVDEVPPEHVAAVDELAARSPQLTGPHAYDAADPDRQPLTPRW